MFCLPTVGRASQVAPLRGRVRGSGVGQGRRGDIHVARMTDAHMRVKRGQSLTRGRDKRAAMSCPMGTGRHKWRPYGVWRGSGVGQGRRGDIHVARITDAYTRVKRGQSLTRGRRSCCLPAVGRASQVAPPRGAARFVGGMTRGHAVPAPGVTSGAPTGSRRGADKRSGPLR